MSSGFRGSELRTLKQEEVAQMTCRATLSIPLARLGCTLRLDRHYCKVEGLGFRV